MGHLGSRFNRLNTVETSMADLTHFDERGASRMVDIGEKPITTRVAVAEACITMQPETLQLIRDRKFAKGDVFEVARLAGQNKIAGKKETKRKKEEEKKRRTK